jgi:alkanesulfonate monooxygenase SsuD/methylene tetrahydromethanopterin reductase-like flavin-dependent oxidoreductase (luciferase family)
VTHISFGIHIGQQNISIDELRRVWSFADTHGFDWLSIWDHFYSGTDETAPHFEAVALLGALASETRHVRIACMVFATQYRNLGLLAKSMMTVDHLSGGRLEFGLGAGWHEPEFRAFGYDFLPVGQRMDQLDEGLRAMRSLLERETTTLDGRWSQLREARVNPKPLQPRIPLWVGGQGERRTARSAARYADGWNIPYVGPDDFARKSAILDEWCAKEGRDPAAVRRATQLGFFMAATNDQAAVDAALDAMAQKLGQQAHTRRAGQLTGGPAEVAETIADYAAHGVTALNIAIRPPVDWPALETFVAEIMPRFAG